MQKEQLFWQFYYEHFQWQKRTLDLNNLQKATPIPLFPRNLLPPQQSQEKAHEETHPAPPNININTTPVNNGFSEPSWLEIPPSKKQALATATLSKQKQVEENPQHDQGGTEKGKAVAAEKEKDPEVQSAKAPTPMSS